jgi:hypothetical protein
LEALFRLGVQRVDYFREPWNVFDFVVVLLSIAGMLLKTVAVCTNHPDWQGESSGLAGQSKILNDRV